MTTVCVVACGWHPKNTRRRQAKTDSKMAARAILVEKVPLQLSTPELRLLTGQGARMTSPSGPPPGSGAAQHWVGQGLRKLS